jgi:hypothetical protein
MVKLKTIRTLRKESREKNNKIKNKKTELKSTVDLTWV